MQRKHRLPVAVGERVYFRTAGKPAENLPYVTLERFSFDGSSFSWRMVTSKYQVISGSIKGEQDSWLFPGSWIAVALPVRIHSARFGLPVDFIFSLPNGTIPVKVP